MILPEDNIIDKMFDNPMWIILAIVVTAIFNSMWLLLYGFAVIMVFGLAQYLIVSGDYKD